jgi:hypothetical protein
MARGLGRCSLALLATALLGIHARAAGPLKSSAGAPILDRYLALDQTAPSDVRALRHLEARNEQFNASAWMDVWTEADGSGFRYRVAGEGGSDYIRSKVFRACLEAERKMWAENAPASTAMTPANYMFEDAGVQLDGLTSFFVKPRRKDALLVDGSIYLDPDDGDLVRVEGRLIKPPSFWTRRVDVVRWYRRLAGIRVPVAFESVANVRIVGESTFRATYDYEFVNSQRVGSPQPLLAYANVTRHP